MYLKYYLDEDGKRVYTLKVQTTLFFFFLFLRLIFLLLLQRTAPDGTPTVSAHPAKFSPDDKYSRQRIQLKKRYGILLTQQPQPKY